MSATQKHELHDVQHRAGGLVDVTVVEYRRKADERDVCPFCESDEGVRFVDRIGEGGTFRTRRYECECGAHGEKFWTWQAGTLESDLGDKSDGGSR